MAQHSLCGAWVPEHGGSRVGLGLVDSRARGFQSAARGFQSAARGFQSAAKGFQRAAKGFQSAEVPGCMGFQSAPAQQLRCMGLLAPLHMGSSWTRDRAHVASVARWILNP